MSNDGPIPTKAPIRKFFSEYLKLGGPLGSKSIDVDDITYSMSVGTVLNGGNPYASYTLQLGESEEHSGLLRLASDVMGSSSIGIKNLGSPYGYEFSFPLSVSNTAGRPMLSSGSQSYLVPYTWGELSASLSYSISAIANAAGLIRITTSATHSFVTGDTALVEASTANTGADGEWTVTVIDGTHVDLQGSTFANTSGAAGSIFPAPQFLTARAGRTMAAGHVVIDANGIASSTGEAITLVAMTAPGTPSAGSAYLYLDSGTGKVSIKNDSGVITQLN